ncbi:MAG: YciI family protein [Acidobacteriota bacterium]|nr:YciI family protein [Acidobacteriota bacterium]
MHCILFYDIVENYVERRVPFRSEHLALAKQAYERGDLVMGGALADPVDGVVIVFRGPSTEAAEAFAKADPYVKSGLVKSWRVRKWNTVIGEGSTTP